MADDFDIMEGDAPTEAPHRPNGAKRRRKGQAGQDNQSRQLQEVEPQLLQLLRNLTALTQRHEDQLQMLAKQDNLIIFPHQAREACCHNCLNRSPYGITQLRERTTLTILLLDRPPP